METQKFYIIRIKTIQNIDDMAADEPDDPELNPVEYVLNHSIALSSNIPKLVADFIGDRGEYLDWVEMNNDEIFAEEWVIYDEDIVEELQMQDFGVDDVEIIIEESSNKWEKIDGDWQIAAP